MRTLRALLPATCLLLVASAALADGGTLHLRPRLPEDVFRIWPSQIQLFEDPAHATVVLEGELPEEVFVFESGGEKPARFVITKSKPRRLFIDLNGDGRCQPGELHTAYHAVSERFRFRKHEFNYFESVPLPVRIPGTLHFLTANLNFHIFPLRPYSLSAKHLITLWWVQTHYEGTLALEGVEYPARLGFRSPLPESHWVNEVIILDSSPDGRFDPDTDLWFSGNGGAWLNDKFCAVETLFSGSEARVSIQPYTGPTGYLKVEGEGYIERLSVAITPPGATEAATYEIALPHQESRVYPVPIGDCAPGLFLLLKPKEDAEVCFEYAPREESPAGAKVAADATAGLPLAGPLTGKVSAEVLRLQGKLALGYAYANPAGLRYRVSWRSESRPRGPLFQVLDRKGKEVASGRFEYG